MNFETLMKIETIS